MKIWLIAIGKFLSRAIPKFLVNRGVLKLTGKRSLMLLSFILLTGALIIYDGQHEPADLQQEPSTYKNSSNPAR